MKKILYLLYSLRNSSTSRDAKAGNVNTSIVQKIVFLQLALAFTGISGIAQTLSADNHRNMAFHGQSNNSFTLAKAGDLTLQNSKIALTHHKGFIEQIIRGRVTDNHGEPLPGVTVLLKGTTIGTNTDLDGKYTLSVPDDKGSLIFSYIGYIKQEVSIHNRSVIDIKLMDDLKSLEEIVVVGYGQQKKITLTGATSSVSGTEIRQNPSASLANSLTGRLPGVFSTQRSGRPGNDGAALLIRGQSSYNGNNQPLIMVDNIEFTYDQFSRLDPNEIESLTVLKDASTTAIYGVKGANGVIVVTTRRGKIGKPQITLRGGASFAQPTKLPHYLDSYQTAQLYNQAQINDNAITPDPKFQPKFTDDDLELFKNGQDPYGHPNIDWKKVLFKNFSSQYRGNVDVSGGTEKVKYFISGGYLWQDGMLRDYSQNQGVRSNYYNTRYNYRSNVDIKMTSTLDLQLDLYGNLSEINNPSFGSAWGYNDIFYDYSSFLSLAPFAYPIHNPDGSFGYSKWQRNEAGGGNYNRNNIVGRLTNLGYSRDFENNMNFVGAANQKLDFITQGLSLKGTLSYASTHKFTRSMTRGEFPSYIYNTATDTYEPTTANLYRISSFSMGYNPGSTTRKLNMQVILNYDRTFGNHHINGLGLINQITTMSADGGANYSFVPENFRGFSGRIGYDYKQKYLLQFNTGYNGSDRFSKGHRFGFFPAISGGWNIADEPFFKDNIEFVNRFKVRTSYGTVGNDKLGSGFTYYYEQTYNSAGSASFGYSNNSYPGITEGTLSNFNVTWEKEKKFDIGVELGILKNRISATIDYFNNYRYDILTTRGTVSAIFGQSLPPVNLGQVRNKGYELELIYRETINQDLSFTLKGNYSVAKNKIQYMDEPTPLYPYQAQTGNSIGQIKVYKSIGFYKDQEDINNSPKTVTAAYPGDLKYEDVNNDGIVNTFDMVVTGYPNIPNTNFGAQLNVNFKGFSIDVLLQGARNFNVRGTAEAIRAFSSNLMDIHTKSWTPELGDNAQYPRLSFNGGVSDPLSFPSTFWFISGNYIRLKTAELSYTFPNELTKMAGIENVRIYANGYNLLTWSSISKRYEFDPEINSGTDRSNYPPQRMVNLGISLTF